MARRASEQPLSAPTDDLAVLRTQWKWAAFSQFISTFSPLLHVPDVTVTDIENDLVHGTNKVIARVMQRLLYTLSYDRKISLENWQSALRKQYIKRNPLANPLGSEPPREAAESRERTPEDQEAKQVPSETLLTEPDSAVTPQAGPSVAASEASPAPTHEPEDKAHVVEHQVPVDWFELPMLAKLDSLHFVTEWQFQNPTRLRTLMRNDDELATWRHEPIGYDSKKNSFWLIGGDRLWIQRVLPKPPKSRKRKRPAGNQKGHQASQKPKPLKRPRTQTTPIKLDASPRRPGSGRAAKIQAKIKLDAQVKELAEFTRQVNGNRPATRLSNRPKPPSRALGTRVSARLRGSQGSEWQAVPVDWMDESSDSECETNIADPVDQNRSQRDPQQTLGIHDDSDSELTELSDDSDEEVPKLNDEQVHPTVVEDDNTPAKEEESGKQVDDAFIEWETICVTLEEWEHITERFENATHYLEKALYKFLTNEIVPEITETLRELERKKRMENALVHRKKSSRIALRESEKEEARLTARRQAEEKEKMSRSRRLEVRKQREEEERLRREQGREQRRKEREARESRRQAELEEHENQSSDREPEDEISTAAETSHSRTTPSNPGILKRRTRPSTSNTYKGVKSSDWELDCEICRRRGVNPEDESPMMSCGKCLKWQHITCHDQADERAGHAKRNWDVVEFVCQQCRSRMFSAPEASSSPTRDHHHRFVNRQNANYVPSNSHTAAYHPYFSQGYTTSQSSSSPPQPQPSAISTLYHAANGRYNYTQPYGDPRTSGIPDRYLSSGQPYMSTHLYSHQPSSISFSHYQPQGGGFTPNGKAQGPHSENYDQRLQSTQHASYSDIRSSPNQRSTVGSPSQIAWNISTPVAGSYTTPYQSAACSNGIPRRDSHL
ncbi:hypothetical protein Agabi119p4_5478 [Agaricus bisporus var. burnettii]|uniref:Zinc finger PHD-type domain-containing protein n=1 Tax=Agaricus bisporus var. burnettii TaxID=192524 RepID=A0A8H7F1R9_AGABI|nr:hypothetical protein Agabi119p4_5478 [Agaricus bisporus var. burnettii]